VRFVLDTNTCIYALKLEGQVVERLRDHSPDDLGVTIVTLAELWFGAHKSARAAAARREIDGFLEPFEVLPFDREAAEAYARSRRSLERIGRPIGERDLLIASIALARGLTVVTHNLSEFGRVPGLKAEDWWS
jgi:tRNA(fMet)-specific endonuclease VapC